MPHKQHSLCFVLPFDLDLMGAFDFQTGLFRFCATTNLFKVQYFWKVFLFPEAQRVYNIGLINSNVALISQQLPLRSWSNFPRYLNRIYLLILLAQLRPFPI